MYIHMRQEIGITAGPRLLGPRLLDIPAYWVDSHGPSLGCGLVLDTAITGWIMDGISPGP